MSPEVLWGRVGGPCWKNCSHPSISKEHWTQRNPQIGARHRGKVHVSLFRIAKMWKWIERPFTAERINRMQHHHVHTMEYFSVTKRDELPARTRTRINLGNITLRDRSQRPNILGFHLYEISRISESIGTERVVAAWGWERGGARE